MITHPICNQCGKEIWGISHIKYTLGVEAPITLHAVCYEKLMEKISED